MVGRVLRVDGSYRDLANWTHEDDEFNKFFRFSDGRGITNAQGFRPKSRSGGSTAITDCGFCLLITTLREPEWPDALERDSGVFTYYGDNREPGTAIADTHIGGNRLLELVFERLHDGYRHSIPPFLCFQKYVSADGGTYMRFLGLAVPGAQGMSSLDDLVAVWRRKGDERFLNYKATFTILDAAEVSHTWLDSIVSGEEAFAATDCPPTYLRWVQAGRYVPLITEPKSTPRTKDDQQPRTAPEELVLEKVKTLTPRQFEHAAADLLGMMDSRFIDIRVTREVRDGGRDVIAKYIVGHGDHGIPLDVSVEVKLWDRAGAVGVKPMMRLISRLKYRDFGVFITTTFFDKTVQDELIEDGHPVILVSGGDVARILIENEIVGASLDRWLESFRNFEEVN
jgi:hypothetical protein